jgi:hypothetical protein
MRWKGRRNSSERRNGTMSERLHLRATELPREVVVIDEQGEKKVYLLKCSRRKLGLLLGAAEHSRVLHSV